MKTGIFGGSFNPVHKGHIHLAESVRDELGLDRIFLVPSGISPHRSSAEYASAEDRLEMLRLACKGKRGLEVCDFEVKSSRISYTIYTIEHFRRSFPDDELFLLAGSDMLLSFDQWYRYRDILANAVLAVVSREDGDSVILAEKAERLSEFGQIIVCKAPPVMVSSTKIRKKIAKNEDWSCYLNENVVQYIRLKGLYGRDEVSF